MNCRSYIWVQTWRNCIDCCFSGPKKMIWHEVWAFSRTVQPHTGAFRTHDELPISWCLEHSHSTVMRKWKWLFVNLVENSTAFLNSCQDGENASLSLAIVWKGSAIHELRLALGDSSALCSMCTSKEWRFTSQSFILVIDITVQNNDNEISFHFNPMKLIFMNYSV